MGYPRVVALVAHKGGVGKTTSAVALAAAWARAGVRTLLVDLDPQGHATLGLGVELGDDAVSVRDVLTDRPIDAGRAVVGLAATSDLWLLPATIGLERTAVALYARPRRETVLARALAPIAGSFGAIVIDCAPSLGALVENAVAVAGLVVVPCRMDARAGDGLVDLLELVAIVRGEAFAGWRILRTQIDRRKSVTNAAVLARLDPYRAAMLETIVPACEALNQAQIQQTDIFRFDAASTGAIAYTALAAELAALPEDVWGSSLLAAPSI